MIQSVFGEGPESLEAAQFCKRWLALVESVPTTYAMEHMQDDETLPEVWRGFAQRIATRETRDKTQTDLYQQMISDLEEHDLLPHFAISMFRVTGYERDALRQLLGVYGFERTLGGHNALSL